MRVVQKQKLYATESQEQQALIKWWRMQYPEYSMLLFHIPNGGFRHIKTAARLKSEGVVPGVADLFLAIPRMGYAGLFIEMKRCNGGTQTDAQKLFEQEVRQQGYCYALCHGWENASEYITHYMRF